MEILGAVSAFGLRLGTPDKGLLVTAREPPYRSLHPLPAPTAAAKL
jgi:hypothetical protein